MPEVEIESFWDRLGVELWPNYDLDTQKNHDVLLAARVADLKPTLPNIFVQHLTLPWLKHHNFNKISSRDLNGQMRH